MSGIIWLASCPKSGNTWLRAFLANYFRDLARPIPIDQLPNYAVGDNFLIHYAQISGRPIEELTDEAILALRPQVHRWFATARGETVFVKTHSLVGKVGDLPLITPEVTAGAIYVLRHPFDIAVSWSHHYQTTLDQAVDALCRADHYLPRTDKLFVQYLGSWAHHVHSWTTAPGLTRHILRYEDLHTRPARMFAGLIQFLGLPLERDRLEKAIQFSSFGELARQERTNGFVEARPDGKTRFFRSGRSGQGAVVLSDSQRERLLAALGPVMERFGYRADGSTGGWSAAVTAETGRH
jgi:hypothetical protein